MNDDLDNLKSLWKNDRSKDHRQPGDSCHIIAKAKQQMKSSIHLQLRTILILAVTLVGMASFFMYVAKFKQPVSHIGTGLMLGGLALRIIIECFSIFLSNNINLSETALRSNNTSLAYFQFRKQINGPVTFIIIILYSIGFYMLTPEFSLYFSKAKMILIDLSYIPVAMMFTWFIRKTIKKETKIRNEILRIRKDIKG